MVNECLQIYERSAQCYTRWPLGPSYKCPWTDT